MNARSPAWCARTRRCAICRARVIGFKLIIGAEFSTVCGLKLVLLAPSQAAYAQICQLITLGRRRSKKGEYRLTRADFESNGLDECLALWVLPRAGDREAQARMAARFFPRSRLAGRGAASRRRRCARSWRACARCADRLRLPAVAAGDVHMHVRVTPARCRMCSRPCAMAARSIEAGWRLHPNGERHLRPLAALRALYPPALLDRALAIAERCSVLAGAAALRISARTRAGGPHAPASICAR